MSIGGLGARAALLKGQKNTKPCERCGLHYISEENEQCPHCNSLDEAGLKKLIEQVERHHQGNKKLGMMFFIVMLAVGFIMLVLSGA